MEKYDSLPTVHGPGRRTLDRRAWLGAGVAAAGAAVIPGWFVHSTARAAQPTGRTEGYLLVADTVAERIYVYSLPSITLTGHMDGVRLGAHAGLIALPDGRLLFVDDKAVEFLAVRIDSIGAPVVIGRASIPVKQSWNRVAWSVVDPGFRYYALSSDDEGADQTITVVDLDDFRVGQLTVTTAKNRNDAYEEVHPYLAGNPLMLYATTGEAIQGWAVADVMAGQAGAPRISAALTPNPHGPLLQPGMQRLLTTTAGGLAIHDLQGATLAAQRTVSWEVSGVRTSQNARPRLSPDGMTVYGTVTRTVSPPLAPADWAEQEALASAIDLRRETNRHIPIAKGIVGRFTLGMSYALFWNVHPDGDFAHLLDIDPSSPTFQEFVARVPLAKLGNGPIAGQTATGREARTGTITPDGRWAFVGHGGDAKISVIDTRARALSSTINLPSPLRNGGYIVAVQPGMPLFDLHAR